MSLRERTKRMKMLLIILSLCQIAWADPDNEFLCLADEARKETDKISCVKCYNSDSDVRKVFSKIECWVLFCAQFEDTE